MHETSAQTLLLKVSAYLMSCRIDPLIPSSCTAAPSLSRRVFCPPSGPGVKGAPAQRSNEVEEYDGEFAISISIRIAYVQLQRHI